MKRYRHIFATILLFVLLGAILICSAVQYYEIERRSCFSQLTDYTEQVKNEIIDISQENVNYLKEIANIIETKDIHDTVAMNEILTSVGKPYTMIRMELLYADGSLLSNQNIIDASQILSYSEIIESKKTISCRMDDVNNSNTHILRYFQPVQQNNQNVALLCGVVDLQQFMKEFTLYGYLADMQFYIIEANSYNFILDTYHEEMGNIVDLGNRETAKGYHWNDVITGIKEQKTGSVVFYSTNNNYFYAHYQPIGIADWVLMITIPEPIAFARANKILRMLYVQAALLLLIFIGYLIWLAYDVHKERKQSNEQLNRTKFLLDVEKELFEAHLDAKHFKSALQILADYYSAQKAFIYLVDASSIQLAHFIANTESCLNRENEELLKETQKIYKRVKKKGEVISDDPTSLEEFKALKNYLNINLDNMILIAVDGIEYQTSFILGVFNMRKFKQDSEPIKQVSLSFAMALNHHNVYQTLNRISKLDKLTGLKNRNCFNETLEQLSITKDTMFACVYIDANGLHEINNKLGHNAGDKMLQTVANELLEAFAYDLVFRIGGDEFIVLSENSEEALINHKIQVVQANLKKHNYEISYGLSWIHNNDDIQAIVNAAESVMRKNKQIYYQSKESERHMRLLNEQVEKMVADKNDADAFLEVLAPEFKGVYFVNLNQDTIRHLFIPPYFESILKATDDKFSQAMNVYADQIVVEEYREILKQFNNYEHLISLLDEDITPECIYQKMNGDWMKLNILKFKDYSKDNRETLWIFKIINHQ